jgi:hypothetical protein
MSIAPDLLRSAMETYHLELHLQDGLNPDALKKAISSALETHERAVLQRVATEAESFAIGMDAEENENPDFAVALRWWAHKILADLGPIPHQDPYQPVDDDVVEVILTGSVIVWNTDDPDGDYQFSIIDDVTGEEYSFRTHPKRAPRLRVLSKNN